MAVDEECLLAAVAGGAPPCLRSLRAGADPGSRSATRSRSPRRATAACRDAGVQVRAARDGRSRGAARRRISPTALRRRLRALPAGLDSSYRLLSDAILAALRELGVEAERAASAGADRTDRPTSTVSRSPPPTRSAPAAASSPAAPSVAPAGAVLQHGSIRLEPDPAAAAAAVGLGRGATSLRELGVDGRASRGRAWSTACPRRSAGFWVFASRTDALDPSRARRRRGTSARCSANPSARRAAGHAPPQEHRPRSPIVRVGSAASAGCPCTPLLLGR